MTATVLKTVDEHAKTVLEELTGHLKPGASRNLDRGNGFMAVHVARLAESTLGPLFSVSHYFLQDEDLCPDPDCVMVRAVQGWTPISFQNSFAYRVAIKLRDVDHPEVNVVEHSDLIEFVNMWMRNIADQQGLAVTRAR